MKESEFENILERYPELIENDLTIDGRQVGIGRLHVDLMYRDRFGQRLIVELKCGTILRDHIAQLFDYEGYFLRPSDPNVRIMLIGNRVPPNMRRSLEHHGFEWREFTIPYIIEFLSIKEDTEYLKYFEEEIESAITPITSRVVRKTPSSKSGITKTSDKFYTLFASKNLGRIFTRKEIIEMLLVAFPDTKKSGVIPSDYCYNMINAGIKFEHHLFEYLGNSRYKVLGKDYLFVGPILWKGRKVGEWQKGSKGPILHEKVKR